MRTHLMEAVSDFNWGKFAVSEFTDDERATPSTHPGANERSLIRSRGWGGSHILVLDLQTGEGAMFHPSGYAVADLMKHRIWVCPLYEPFLTWLYTHWQTHAGGDKDWLDSLPALVELPDAPFALGGYRRPGPD